MSSKQQVIRLYKHFWSFRTVRILMQVFQKFFSVEFFSTCRMVRIEVLMDEIKRLDGEEHEFQERDEPKLRTKEFMKMRTAMILIDSFKELIFSNFFNKVNL